MISKQLIDTLKTLGLNSLEAEVYCTLLEHNGITAYRLAKLLNKATANVYKAVKVLSGLGGLTIERSNKELCRAVEPELFLASLDAVYQESKAKASMLLNKNRYKQSDEGIYRLDNAQLAIQHAKNAIDGAQHAIVIDAFPKILEILRDHLTRAIERGIEIHIQSYHDFELLGAEVVRTFGTKKTIKLWNTEQLNLVVDGKECLICLFSKELTKINQAMWSKDIYLSCVLHVGLRREHFFHQLKDFAENNKLPQKLAKLIGRETNLIMNKVLSQGELDSLLQSGSPEEKELAS